VTTHKIKKKEYQFGRHLQKVRKSKDITQEELAENIGVSQTWIAYLETGRTTPSIKILQKVAKALGVKVKDLIPF
jgi:transcriptional regulator with XRE-family HTH domain